MTTPTRFQFSLRTLFVVMTLWAVALATVSTLGLKLVLGCSGLAFSCGFVLLLALLLIPLDSAVSRREGWTSFVFTALLFCGLALAFCFFDAAINQPHPYYLNSGQQVTNAWLVRAVVDSAVATPLPAFILLLPVAFHLESRTNDPRDRAYYPRLMNVWRGLGLLRVRLILIIGGLLVFGYYGFGTIGV